MDAKNQEYLAQLICQGVDKKHVLSRMIFFLKKVHKAWTSEIKIPFFS